MAEKREQAPDGNRDRAHDRAHDLAEQGLDKLIEGDNRGKEMIDQAKKLDPQAVEELAQEVERDKEEAEHFVGKP